MTRLMLLPLLLVAGSSAGAQEGAPAEAPAVLRISLSDAVARAQASSARLAEARSLEDAASAGLRGAEAGRMPQVDLSASYTRNSEIPELTFAFPGSGPQTLFPSIPNNYRAHAGVALPLYTGGRVGAAIESAREGLAAAGKDRERAAADVVLDTTVAYWSLVRARAEARVLADAVSSFEAHLKDATNREALGMAARNEVLAVQVERDEAELSRLGADGDAEVAEANLARILDLAPGTPIEPTEPLASQGVEGDLETLVERAAADRPEVAALRSRAAALEASARVARSASRPQAGLQAGFDYARPNMRILPPTDEWNRTWSVGVTLSLTPWDGGRAGAAEAQARAEAEAAQHALEDLLRVIRLDVTARLLDLRTSRSAVDVAERGLGSARENVRVSQDRYREGLIPSSELLDAETALLRAGLRRTVAVTRVEVDRARLDRAVGR